MPLCLLIFSFRYDAANVKNDIAIIKLNKAVDFTRGSVGTVCLPYEYTGFGKIESLVGPPWIIGESKIKSILTQKLKSVSPLEWVLWVLQYPQLLSLDASTHTWTEDGEAYRKIFDYWSGSPDFEQTDDLRLQISRSRLKKFFGLA